jgi:outer membrane biosynthesis protein TonB
LVAELRRECKERGITAPKNVYVNCEKLDALADSFDTRDRVLQYINKNKPQIDVDDDAVDKAPKKTADVSDTPSEKPVKKRKPPAKPMPDERVEKIVDKVQRQNVRMLKSFRKEESDSGEENKYPSDDDDRPTLVHRVTDYDEPEDDSEDEPEVPTQGGVAHRKLSLPSWMFQ